MSGHLPPLCVRFCSSYSPGDLSRPLLPEIQGGALTGGFLSCVISTYVKVVARSAQVRDRSATFGQKGCACLETNT